MAIKKVTVEDLMSVRGGGSIDRAEKKAIKEIAKETGQKAKDLRKKNEDQKGKSGTPVNDPAMGSTPGGESDS